MSSISKIKGAALGRKGWGIGIALGLIVYALMYKKEQYEIVSFLDVANGTIKPEYFKGKIVILGITEVGAGDIVSTPIGSIPGPLVHYTFISNVLQGHLVTQPKYIASFLVIFFVLLPFIQVLLISKIVYRAGSAKI